MAEVGNKSTSKSGAQLANQRLADPRVEALADKIKHAASIGQPLNIVGGNSKAFYGQDLTRLETISSQSLNKIINYEPSELVVQVEAGCSIEALAAALDAENQMLGFDPADFGGSTIGGAIASGLSGSRRPFRGAGRDFLLGVGVIDGTGQYFEFGGQVMKNVAGYDISRLMSGALGCLGMMTQLSLKVLPKPELEISMSKPLARDQVLPAMKKLAALPETSALSYWQDQLHIRFSGSDSSVSKCQTGFGGQVIESSFWKSIDTLSIFEQATSLWRISTDAANTDDGFHEANLIDWGGAQRWLIDCPKPSLQSGYATLVKTNETGQSRFTELEPYVKRVHRDLKSRFDPKGILNPGKMYADL